MAKELTVWEVGKMFSQVIPPLKRRGHCPFRKHKRRDKSFSVYTSLTGDVLYHCFSCDPPFNVGDAVALYATLSNVDRKSAWHDLRDRGYAVPGAESYRGNDEFVAQPIKRRVPVRGVDDVRKILPFDLGSWRQMAEARLGAVERFASMRGIDAGELRRCDVVDVADDVVGFGYRDPYTSLPCRVKCRPLYRKTFWIEPRPPEGVDAKALGPLYLAHDLDIPVKRFGQAGPNAIIVEGEIDALTLRSLGFKNVVSLPDGCGSASKVSLEPISSPFALWLVSTDADEEGERAYREIRARGWALSLTVARVTWKLGDACFKDANDALVGGMRRDDFVACLGGAAEYALGYRVAV